MRDLVHERVLADLFGGDFVGGVDEDKVEHHVVVEAGTIHNNYGKHNN